DGLPASGAVARLLDEARGPDDLAAATGAGERDRWQAQVLGRVLRRADVWLHAGGLSDHEVRSAHLRPVGDLSAAVAEALDAAGPGARCCVLPHGPLGVAVPAA
ncbi:MAG: nickel-dependent lactate racemase, partial [Acidimicrobiales bacterium]